MAETPHENKIDTNFLNYLLDNDKTYSFMIYTLEKFSKETINVLKSYIDSKYELNKFETKDNLAHADPLYFAHHIDGEVYVYYFETKRPVSPPALENDILIFTKLTDKDLRVLNATEDNFDDPKILEESLKNDNLALEGLESIINYVDQKPMNGLLLFSFIGKDLANNIKVETWGVGKNKKEAVKLLKQRYNENFQFTYCGDDKNILLVEFVNTIQDNIGISKKYDWFSLYQDILRTEENNGG